MYFKIFFYLSLICVSSLSAVQVEVEQGLLEGQILETVDGIASYYSFKGIPYAAPPVGDLRFKAPQPAIKWDGVRSAIDHGAMCPQYDDFSGVLVNITEDCLFLNVYSPNIQPETPLPVMFYIHGGGYKFGSGDVSELGPDFLVSKDVIVVTFNYRLDALGYLCLDTEEVPGNAGSKDQVAALRWVVANIAMFGGNPDSITLVGQSAGASSVAHFMMSPMTKGLFKRAIMMSGTPLQEWTFSYKPAERGISLGKLLGSNTNDPHETYEFLKTVPFSSLVNLSVPIMSAEENFMNIVIKGRSFVPVVEKDFGQERFITDDAIKLMDNGEVQDVSILIGKTNQETLAIATIYESLGNLYESYPDLQVPRDMIYGLTAEKSLEVADMIHKHYFGDDVISLDNIPKLAELLDDSFIDFSVNRFLNRLPESNSTKKFAYIFSALTERNPYGWLGESLGILGAAHVDDLVYLFDPKAKNYTLNLNSTEYQVIHSLTTLFTNFAKYDHPTPGDSLGLIWPEYNKFEGKYLEIGVEISVNSRMGRRTDEFWKSVYDFADIEY